MFSGSPDKRISGTIAWKRIRIAFHQFTLYKSAFLNILVFLMGEHLIIKRFRFLCIILALQDVCMPIFILVGKVVLSVCIKSALIITLYNVCAVLWGRSVPWGMFSTMGDVLSTVGVFNTVGDIMSTVGYSNNKRFSPHGTEHPTVFMISPMCIMISPQYWVSPMVLKITPTVLMISPMVPNNPHGNQDVPQIYHDVPPRYWTSPRNSRYPPTCIMISPHGTAHTLYRVITSFPAQTIDKTHLKFVTLWQKSFHQGPVAW